MQEVTGWDITTIGEEIVPRIVKEKPIRDIKGRIVFEESLNSMTHTKFQFK